MQPHLSPNLIEEFNKGNEKVRGKVCGLLVPNITEMIRDRLGRSCETTDLVSEVITRLLENKGSFETTRHLENYVETITINVCKDEMKKKKKRSLNAPHISTHLMNIQERNLENARNLRICQRLTDLAIEMLPAKARQVFLLSFIGGLTIKETAEQMGIGKRTVEDHIYFAYKKLRIRYYEKPGNIGRYIVFWFSLPFLISYMLLQNCYHERFKQDRYFIISAFKK
jgi:RNA polymerase sigma-70 factor, ECF subfamily